MLGNLGKCSVMPMYGGRETSSRISYGYMVLKVSEEDLGLVMHNSSKPSRQCAEAPKKANSTLGMTNSNQRQGYSTEARPQLGSVVEYCIQAWNPYLKQDISWRKHNKELQKRFEATRTSL